MKLETTLLIILLQIYSWIILDITKVQNKLGKVSVVIPDCFFSPFRCVTPGILVTPVHSPIFALCVLFFVQKQKKVLKCVI